MGADYKDWEWLEAGHYGRGRRGAEVTGGVDHFIAGGSGRATARWVAGLAVYQGKKVPAPKANGHIITCRDGHVIQQVRFADRAYHAGTSPERNDFWKKKKPPRNVNDFTVGIENANYGWLFKVDDGFFIPRKDERGEWTPGKPYDLKRFPAPKEAFDHNGLLRWWEPYTDECIKANIHVKTVLADLGLVTDPSNWQGHSDVSPDRKTDPGPLFPIRYILEEVFGSQPTLTSQEAPGHTQDLEDIPDLETRVDPDLYDEDDEMCLDPDQ